MRKLQILYVKIHLLLLKKYFCYDLLFPVLPKLVSNPFPLKAFSHIMAVVVHPCGNSAVEMVYKFCKPPGNQVAISYKKNKENSKVGVVWLSVEIVASSVCFSNKFFQTFGTAWYFCFLQEPFVTLDNGITVSGLLTTIKAIVRFSEKSQNVSSSLLGKDFLEEAEVEQWLEYCLTQVTPCLKNVGEVKDVLKVRVYDRLLNVN